MYGFSFLFSENNLLTNINATQTPKQNKNRVILSYFRNNSREIDKVQSEMYFSLTELQQRIQQQC